jgi:hypothetical protein
VIGNRRIILAARDGGGVETTNRVTSFFSPALRDETLDPKKDQTLPADRQEKSRQKYASLHTGRPQARIFVRQRSARFEFLLSTWVERAVSTVNSLWLSLSPLRDTQGK